MTDEGAWERASHLGGLLKGFATEIRTIHGAEIAHSLRVVARDPSAFERPLRPDAEFATDFANDWEWAAMIAEGSWLLEPEPCPECECWTGHAAGCSYWVIAPALDPEDDAG